MNVILIPFDAHKRADNEEVAEATANDVEKTPITEDLLQIDGRTSLYWTARALAHSNRIRNIQVLSSQPLEAEIRRELPDDRRFEIYNVDEGPLASDLDFSSEQLAAIEKIGKEWIKTPTLIVSCAAPHWAGKIYDDIVTYVRDSSLDSAAFYIQHKNFRASMPEEKTDLSSISFFKQRLHILPIAVVGPEFIVGASRQKHRLSPHLERMMESEEPRFKDYFPLGIKVAKLLGFRFIRNLIKKNLSPELVDKTVRRIFDVRFECIELNEPTLPLTLSNEAHYAKIESLLASSPVHP